MSVTGYAKTPQTTWDINNGDANITHNLTVGGSLNVTGTINGTVVGGGGSANTFSSSMPSTVVTTNPAAILANSINVVTSASSVTLPTSPNVGSFSLVVNASSSSLQVGSASSGGGSLPPGGSVWLFAYNNRWYF